MAANAQTNPQPNTPPKENLTPTSPKSTPATEPGQAQAPADPAASAQRPGNPTAAQNAKAVGGGMQPGHTDTGSSTSPMRDGSTGGFASKSSRSSEGSADSESSGMTGTAGHSVLSTGRESRSDTHAATGGAATSGQVAMPSGEAERAQEDVRATRRDQRDHDATNDGPTPEMAGGIGKGTNAPKGD